MKIDALIVAAGSGTRLGGTTPKQFLPLAGTPMIRRSYNVFANHAAIRQVQVVIGPGHENFYKQAFCSLYALPPIVGGERRQDSVRLGLEAMAADPPDFVLIADAARPFTPANLIDAIVEELGEGAVLPASPCADTLKQKDEISLLTIERTKVFLAQTPQAFPFKTILSLHQQYASHDVTDDIAFYEMAGLPVKVIAAPRSNFKITTSEDFDMAEAILQSQSQNRVGHGFDIHRFAAGDHVWLGGIKIPHNMGVEAHSDGDVILHALTDAILGTIGAGDIGQHFPPSDPQWKDAPSSQFVAHAMNLLRGRGGSIVNADITLLAEAPRIGPYRDAICSHLAALLETETVNIKATTTEKLGAIGRGEGLAAEAVVMVKI